MITSCVTNLVFNTQEKMGEWNTSFGIYVNNINWAMNYHTSRDEV